jgi:hypothetical protein
MVKERIIDGFTPKALDLFQREFDFFDKVTSISGVLFPLATTGSWRKFNLREKTSIYQLLLTSL